MPNYKEIETEYIPSFKPFKHGYSMRAEVNKTDKEYNVYSYSTLLASINVETRQVTFLNLNKYSSTTSRQQNLVKRALSKVGA